MSDKTIAELRQEKEKLYANVADRDKELAQLRAEIERLNKRIHLDAETALQHLNEIDRLREEVATCRNEGISGTMGECCPGAVGVRYVEIHTKEEIAAEVERMRASPEMMWWMRLLNGYWAMQGESGESLMRTEAYNRLTMQQL